MKKKDSKAADLMKIHPDLDAEIGPIAVIGDADAIVYSIEKDFRYIVLSAASKKKLRELLDIEGIVGSVHYQHISKKPDYHSTLSLSENLRRKVKDLIDCMHEESNQYPEINGELLRQWMLEALILIANQCEDNGSKKPAGKSNPLVSKFIKLVDENFIKLNLPKDYAALLFVTPNYLNQISHRVLGKTAGEVIRDRKLLEAKRLLGNPGFNVSQIANNLNFTDPSHFSKFFKKHTGKSPEDFRRNAQEE